MFPKIELSIKGSTKYGRRCKYVKFVALFIGLEPGSIYAVTLRMNLVDNTRYLEAKFHIVKKIIRRS